MFRKHKPTHTLIIIKRGRPLGGNKYLRSPVSESKVTLHEDESANHVPFGFCIVSSTRIPSIPQRTKSHSKEKFCKQIVFQQFSLHLLHVGHRASSARLWLIPLLFCSAWMAMQIAIQRNNYQENKARDNGKYPLMENFGLAL